jgi:hypothetical protein
MAGSSVPNYFFLNNKLYKKIRVVRSEDYIVAWSYEDEMRMRFSNSATRRQATKAYTTYETARLIERPVRFINNYIQRGLIPQPSGRSYTIKNRRPREAYWSQDDILYLRDRIYELTPKNKYGDPNSQFKLISKAELLAKMNDGEAYYVKGDDGQFTRVWKAT